MVKKILGALFLMAIVGGILGGCAQKEAETTEPAPATTAGEGGTTG